MKRTYKKRPRINLASFGRAGFILLIGFVAYRILTPSSRELMQRTAPDETRTARLKLIYHTENPTCRIEYRDSGNRVWRILLNTTFPPEAGIPPDQTELGWSDDSQTLHLLLNTTSVWNHTFRPATQ